METIKSGTPRTDACFGRAGAKIRKKEQLPWLAETDELTQEAEAMERELTTLAAKNEKLVRALEGLKADCQCTIDQYNANGPQWTSRESGAEYYDASFVLESNEEKIKLIDEALAEAKS